MRKCNYKGIKRIITYILILSMMASVFCINVSADDEDYSTYLSTYAARYFHFLHSSKENQHFGLNKEGTCGFVAAGMLLSFYDSYLNDNFVTNKCSCTSECDCDYDALGIINAETFWVHSPGIKQEPDWTDISECTDYNEFIDDNADEFFHLRLLKIGRDRLNLYTPPITTRSSETTPKPEESPWGITIYETGELIQEYFSDFSDTGEEGKIKNGVTIHISSYNDDNHKDLDDPNAAIRNEMVQKIKAGIPVIYYGYSLTKVEGHFMIAYDYDEATDTLYFHTGWNENYSMNDKETEDFIYTANPKILWFEIDEDILTHTHAYNYAYSTTPEIGSVCSCQIYSGAGNHVHSYSEKKYYEDDCHFSVCLCGRTANEEAHNCSYTGFNTSVFHRMGCSECEYTYDCDHEYKLVSISSTYHKMLCDCGRAKGGPLSHSYTNPKAVGSSEYHRFTCSCGAIVGEEAHAVSRCGVLNKSFHIKYCSCGYQMGQELHDWERSGLFYVCKQCGYRAPLDGSIVLETEEDIISE